eukprot:TRINITY_DN5879_c0_g1_i1.p1 TRINITY_DN5879_c0_g1~~TRINITY_DN5879_c0_g1_i1.p1  ORF type:complete len:117 (+),score=36.09 TRINITY_DN5879_c0_g1_i1:83-433(+)
MASSEKGGDKVEKEAYLYFKDEKKGEWTKEKAQIKDGVFSFTKSSRRMRPKKYTIDSKLCDVQPNPTKSEKYFVFEISIPTRIYCFGTETESEMQEWISLLVNSSNSVSSPKIKEK